MLIPRAAVHLVGRFFGSLTAREPRAGEAATVRRQLTPSEFEVWTQMPRADRAEALATRQRLPASMASNDAWAAAALLHDAGKSACGLGTFGRVVATVRGRLGVPGPASGRTCRYLRHAELGAEMLEHAGARPAVVAWARTHHHRLRWPTDLIPAPVCAALARADGEP